MIPVVYYSLPDAAENLGVTLDTLEELIKRRALETVKLKIKGANQRVILQSKVDSLLKHYVFGEDLGNALADVNVSDSAVVLRELDRFTQGQELKNPLIELQPSLTKGDGEHYKGPTFLYPHIEALGKEIQGDTLGSLKMGLALLEEQGKPPFPAEEGAMSFDSIVSRFSQINHLARARFFEYFTRGDLLAYDRGIAAHAANRLQSIQVDQHELTRSIADVYARYYGSEPHFIPFESGGFSKLENLQSNQFPMLKDELEIYAFPKDVDIFESELISQCELFDTLTERKISALHPEKFKQPLSKILDEEAARYGHTTTFLPPLNNKRYHPSDIGSISEYANLIDLGLLNAISLGLILEGELPRYQPTSDPILRSVSQVAAQLKTTEEKARRLSLHWQDHGLLAQVAEKYEVTGEIDRFYDEHFKDKVEGFKDDAVRDYRTIQLSIDQYLLGCFEESVVDFKRANTELQRQYDLDKIKRAGKRQDTELLASELAPFDQYGKLVNTQEDNAALTRLLNANTRLAMRVNLGLALDDLYKNGKEGFVEFDGLKEQLGLTDMEWTNLKKTERGRNPVLEESTWKVGNFMTAEEFDSLYFADTSKRYLTSAEFSSFATEKFVAAEGLCEVITGIGGSFDLLFTEAAIANLKLDALNKYSVNNQQRYLKSEGKKLSEERNFAQLQVALAMNNLGEITPAPYNRASAASFLGIRVDQLNQFVRDAHLTEQTEIQRIGLDTYLSDRGIELDSAQIANALRKDPRYRDLADGTAINRMEGFLSDTKTVQEAQEEVVGKTALGQKIYDGVVVPSTRAKALSISAEGAEDTRVKKYHQSDIDLQSRELANQVALGPIRNIVNGELGVSSLNTKYRSKFEVARGIDATIIDVLQSEVDDFKSNIITIEDCYALLNLDMGKGSLHEIVETLSPGSQQFGSGYHADDVDASSAKLSEATADLRISAQTIADWSKEGYLFLSANGIDDAGKKALRDRSVATADLDLWSSSISDALRAEDSVFTYQDSEYCPLELAKAKILKGFADITDAGISTFLWDESGEQYLAKETSLSKETARENIQRYILRATGTEEDHRYSSEDLGNIIAFKDALIELDIHRINRFEALGSGSSAHIDTHRSFYTSQEAASISGVSVSTLKKEIGSALEHGNYSFYSASQLANYIRTKRPRAASLTDQETIAVSAVSYLNGWATTLGVKKTDAASDEFFERRSVAETKYQITRPSQFKGFAQAIKFPRHVAEYALREGLEKAA